MEGGGYTRTTVYNSVSFRTLSFLSGFQAANEDQLSCLERIYRRVNVSNELLYRVSLKLRGGSSVSVGPRSP